MVLELKSTQFPPAAIPQGGEGKVGLVDDGETALSLTHFCGFRDFGTEAWDLGVFLECHRFLGSGNKLDGAAPW